MDADQLLTSNYYIMVCKAGNLALRIQENDPNKFDKSRIISVEPNVQDVGQLFMVQKIGSGMDQYQIINCLSTFVFDQEYGEIRLRFGKQNKDQLFSIVPAGSQDGKNYFWFKTDTTGNKAVYLEGILRFG